MKSLLLAFSFALAFTSAARGQTSPPGSAKPVTEEQTLKALDLAWHQAVAARDEEALGRLLADDYRFDLDARRVLTKAQEIEAVKASDALFAIDPFKLRDVTVRIEGERATVSGILTVCPKGGDKSSRRRYFYTRTFVSSRRPSTTTGRTRTTSSGAARHSWSMRS